MSKKSQRLDAIRNLIEFESISSQEDILARLRTMGIDATQSTLSRDIKELKAVKVPDGLQGYTYMLPEAIRNDNPADIMSSLVTDNILSIDFSGNIAVLKTKPGYANAVAVLIDNKEYDAIMGTIAGDDNIFIVMHEGASREKLLELLSAIHPGLEALYRPAAKPKRRIFR